VIAYCHATAEEAKTHRPRVVFVDEENAIKDARNLRPGVIEVAERLDEMEVSV
jgi:aspartate 1-decarboxylase